MSSLSSLLDELEAEMVLEQLSESLSGALLDEDDEDDRDRDEVQAEEATPESLQLAEAGLHMVIYLVPN